MTLGLVVDDGGVVDDDLPRHRPYGAGPLAGGTRLLGPKLWQLLSQRLLDRSLNHRPSGIDRDLLQGIEVEIKAWPVIPKRSTSDDLPPTLGQRANLIFIWGHGALGKDSVNPLGRSGFAAG
jgi:hypothetical protein